MSHGKEDQRFSRAERQAATQKVTLMGGILNTLLSVAQIAGGIMTQSQALVADGFHSLSDLLSDGVVLLAAQQAHKEADDKHPYGHGRIETLATVIMGLILAGVAVAIFMKSWGRLFSDTPLVPPQPLAMVFAVAAILGKEALYHYTLRVAERFNSNMLRANAWHHRSDAISSIVVLLGIAGAQFGLPWLDPVAALVVAGMIMYMAGQFILDSTRELVDTGLDTEEVQEIREFINNIEGVENVHMLRTRRMGGHVLADVHLQVNGRISVSEGHHIGETVMYRLRRKFRAIHDVIIHVDPEDDEIAHPCKNLPSRANLLAELQAMPATAALWPLIKDMTLHYIGGKIQLEVVLDSPPPAEALTHFQDACKTVTCIQQVDFLHIYSALTA
jgi:cation diffusion facilitator family transporter